MKRNVNIFQSNRRESEIEAPIFVLDDDEIGYQKLISNKPLIFEGIRGSGKTSLLKTLDWEIAWGFSPIKLVPEKEIKNMIENPEFIGIYIGIDKMEIKIWDDWMNIEGKEKAQNIFSTYFEWILLEQLLNAIDEIRRNRNKIHDDDNEEEFVTEVFNEAFLNNGAENYIREKSLYFLKQKVKTAHKNLRQSIYSNIGFNLLIEAIPIISVPELILCAAKSMRKYFKYFKDFTVFIIIDDFHGFEDWQQEIINTGILRKDPMFTYKLSTLCGSYITRNTREKLRILGQNDLETVVFSESIKEPKKKERSKARSEKVIYKKRFLRLINGIIKTRLEYFYKKRIKDLDFASLLYTGKNIEEKVYDYLRKSEKPEIISLLEEYNKLSTKGKTNILNFWLDKNKIRNYDESYDKLPKIRKKRKISSQYFKKFQLTAALNLCESYPYSGFDEIYQLSNSSIRNFLMIIDSIYNESKIKDVFEFLKQNKISIEKQAKAIRKISNNYLESLDDKKILSEKIRKTEKDICDRLGKLIKSFNKIEYVKEKNPECSSIKLKAVGGNLEINKIIQILISSGNIIKRRKDEYELYALNTILSPYFNLTYRNPFTYSQYLPSEDFESLISCDDKDIIKTIRKILEIILKNPPRLF